MKEINLTYIIRDGKTYIPFDEHIEILESYKLDIERLNNIINELENILKDLIFGSNNLNHKLTAQIILMRLKELKENSNV